MRPSCCWMKPLPVSIPTPRQECNERLIASFLVAWQFPSRTVYQLSETRRVYLCWNKVVLSASEHITNYSPAVPLIFDSGKPRVATTSAKRGLPGQNLN